MAKYLIMLLYSEIMALGSSYSSGAGTASGGAREWTLQLANQSAQKPVSCQHKFSQKARNFRLFLFITT